MRPIADPRESFNVRFGASYLAEEALDLRFYLWNRDPTGDEFLYRALDVADRSVRVCLLIGDIHHADRDDTSEPISAPPVNLFDSVAF